MQAGHFTDWADYRGFACRRTAEWRRPGPGCRPQPTRLRCAASDASQPRSQHHEPDDNWITEICDDGGSAFSLKGRGRQAFEQQSPFQKVEVFDTTSYGKLMLIDGCTMVSTRDNFLYHEMMSHPVLFSHRAPRRVAIIGGGDCGTCARCSSTRRSSMHPDRHRRGGDARAELHFPNFASNADPRARAAVYRRHPVDERRRAQLTGCDHRRLDRPDRSRRVLFTPEFYRACHRALDDGGMVVQQSESPLIHMAILERMYRSLQAADFADARTLFFPQPIYPTGWWSATIGAKNGRLDDFRDADVAARPSKPLTTTPPDPSRGVCRAGVLPQGARILAPRVAEVPGHRFRGARSGTTLKSAPPGR